LKLTSTLIWYVSYGSNLLASRFRTYLEGGQAPGRDFSQIGARDRRPWRDEAAVVLSHALFFAGDSQWWGGGVAFVDPDKSAVEVLGRAYLVTAEQFQDVMAQESGREVGSEVDVADALNGSRVVVGEGKYDLVLGLGTMAGHPMLTFTTPISPLEMALNPPGQDYSETIAAGLAESHGLNRAEADVYLGRFTQSPDR
jgi:hypothetical protein